MKREQLPRNNSLIYLKCFPLLSINSHVFKVLTPRTAGSSASINTWRCEKNGRRKKNEIKTRGEIEKSILHGASDVGQEQVGGAEGTHTQLHSLTAEWRDVNVECSFF